MDKYDIFVAYPDSLLPNKLSKAYRQWLNVATILCYPGYAPPYFGKNAYKR